MEYPMDKREIWRTLLFSSGKCKTGKVLLTALWHGEAVTPKVSTTPFQYH